MNRTLQPLLQLCRDLRRRTTTWLFVVSVKQQRAQLWRKNDSSAGAYALERKFVVSTSRHGIGQVKGSNRTPLGLHRIAKKIGGRYHAGAVFVGRKLTGYTWQGQPNAPIAHRILWLEGLQPGFNRGGDVDTFDRYIYIHGVGDETTIGRPASSGCIHLAADDLIPLYKLLPVGTLVWIQE
jgi:lipoprotein-anchoring transpeptidase ErfK/SrfK